MDVRSGEGCEKRSLLDARGLREGYTGHGWVLARQGA